MVAGKPYSIYLGVYTYIYIYIYICVWLIFAWIYVSGIRNCTEGSEMGDEGKVGIVGR